MWMLISIFYGYECLLEIIGRECLSHFLFHVDTYQKIVGRECLSHILLDMHVLIITDVFIFDCFLIWLSCCVVPLLLYHGSKHRLHKISSG